MKISWCRVNFIALFLMFAAFGFSGVGCTGSTSSSAESVDSADATTKTEDEMPDGEEHAHGDGDRTDHPGHSAHSADGANAHMHSQPFDSLVARFESPGRNEWQKPEEVIAALGPLKKMTVADLGAGTGYFSFPLAREASKVIALDIDERFLDYIKSNKPRRLKVEARKTSESEINLKKGEADVVLTVNTWHHIENRVDYAADLFAKLPEEGRFVIVDFFKEEQPVGPPPFLKVSQKRVRRELFQAGFESTSMDTSTLPYQYIITGYK